MDNNELMMIVLAFVVGYMCSGMMKSMCGGRLIEGDSNNSNGTSFQCPDVTNLAIEQNKTIETYLRGWNMVPIDENNNCSCMEGFDYTGFGLCMPISS